jgi:hypothetical protein
MAQIEQVASASTTPAEQQDGFQSLWDESK